MDAITFAETLYNAGYYPRAYSGRGMYGARCVALTVTPDGSALRDSDLLLIGASFAAVFISDLMTDDFGGDAEEWLASASTDSLGRGIVVYWPGMVWNDEEMTGRFGYLPDDE
jgi:hypothetical protein